jgi:hypothetical protein
VGGLSPKETEKLSQLNPDKIYVENVRSLLGISHASAVQICETAVRQGVFQRAIEVMCPDGAVAVIVKDDEALPTEIRCWREEDGHLEPVMLPTESLDKAIFYRLDDRSDSLSIGQTA